MSLQRLGALTITGAFVLAAALAGGCSGGGGGSSPAPAPVPTLGGIGPDITFDQKVNFTVVVPPAATTNAVAAAVRKRKPSASASASPYISPNIASLTLQVGTVNGQSPRLSPAAVTFNISCGAANGCSVPIQGVSAAKGVDRFAIQTFAGPGATGNMISSSFVDVTVPSAQATSFGGTALTVGGFVASLSLAATIPGGAFVYNTPATGTVDVNALDPAGAVIIGTDQLASAITVTLPATDNGAFTLNMLAQVALNQPAQTLTLAYNGTILVSGTVSASTVDENSQPVATSIPIALKPPPAPPTPVPPSPTPVPVGKAPLSLYVYDGASDRIIEYGGINDFESGKPFATTPRRVFEAAAPASLAATVNGCAIAGNPPLSPTVISLAVSSNATMYAQTSCADANFNSYTFVYSAATQETVTPTASPTPPIPASTFTVNAPNSGPQGIKLDEATKMLFLAYADANFLTPAVIGVPNLGQGAPTAAIGATCIQELGTTLSCESATTMQNGYYGQGNFALDPSGNVVLPTSYQSLDPNNNTFVPPGAAPNPFAGEPAIVLLQAAQTTVAPSPISALAGFGDELGGANNSPLFVATEGGSLYSLVEGPTTFTDPRDNVSQVNPGLSGCPPPASSAAPDTVTNLCADMALHPYLVGSSGALALLASPANAGTNVVQTPTFMLGGDSTGQFGASQFSGPGDPIAVKDGYAYILDLAPISGGPPEIDIYNTNNVTGFHTDIGPVYKLVLDPSATPTTIAVGATGTGTGGLALLRRPARVHHDIKAWRRALQLHALQVREAQRRMVRH